jgi:hypothetical protein
MSLDEPTDDGVEERWPFWNRSALRWVGALEKRIIAIGHPYQRSFISITNALEIQFEEGAVPAAVRLLLKALLATTKASLVAPAALGLDGDADAIYDSIKPKRRRRRGR